MPVVCAVACAAACVYAMRRADPDLWGYLAYGRFFVEHGVPASQDPFAYTTVGYRWVAFEYLAQVLLWEAYKLGGPPGLIGLKCVVGGAAVFFMYLGIRAVSARPVVWIPAFLFATATVSRYFLFRPQLFTFAFLALYAALLLRFLLGQRRGLWALPVAMLAWANLHGGFIAGLGLLGLVLILRVVQNANAPGAGARLLEGTARLWAVIGASMVVTFVNPHGWRLWSYVLTEILHDTNRRYISEWRPALQSGDHWTIVSLVVLTAGLAVLGWLGHRRASIVAGLRPWQWVLAGMPLVLMAFWSVRHVPIAAIWVAPIVALLASNLEARKSDRRGPGGGWAVAGTIACIPAALTCIVVITQPLPRIEIAGDTLGPTHPCSSANFIRQNELTGSLYNPLSWGSYLTWSLHPRVRVSMDGRNISAFPDAVVLENLRFYFGNPSEEEVEAPLRYATDFLLVPSDRPVLGRILSDGRWRRIFADTNSSLFVREGEKGRAIAASLGGRESATTGPACPDFME